jgi:hypothetical protein
MVTGRIGERGDDVSLGLWVKPDGAVDQTGA